MLTASEVASVLHISARKVYELAASGQLASHRFGSAVRFEPADIEAYKQSCRSPATTRAAAPVEPSTRPALLENVAVVKYFGLDRPRQPYEPPPTLTPYQRRKQREEEARRKDEDRRALVTFHANKRRAAKLLRTPRWADFEAIQSFYTKAQRLTAETGIQHHVDHIYPLQGRLVSGLNVHNNLQILTGSENSRKRNRFEVE
jgi:excisionase family DNA binding protein